INDARARYRIAAPIALGYSNGANIAAALLLLRPEVLSDAILLRAMTPLSSVQPPDLAGKRVLVITGAQDPIVPPESATLLADLLRRGGAAVDHRVLPVGHGFSNLDLALSAKWLKAAGPDAGVPASVKGF